MLPSYFAVLAWTASTAFADIRFLTPAAGATVQGAGALQVSWEDSGNEPALEDLTTYQLFLCAGGDDDSSIVQLAGIVLDGKFSLSGNTAEAVVPGTIGASSPDNAYFLKMISVAAKGGTVINFSDRFSMSDMTGVFPASVLSGLKSVSGTDGPASVNNVNQNGGAGADTGAAQQGGGLYATPFADQSGPLLYASMQKVPPTKITKKTMTPINPTSPFTLATTFLPPNTEIQSTVTAPVTWSYSHIEHTGSPAPMPDDSMQKFLNRWKD